MIVRILLPYGAHIRYDGVEKILAGPNSSFIAFDYRPASSPAEPTPKKGHAVFNMNVICGYAKEDEDGVR